mgnify:CR=1 FL=1|tara:strand:- start:1032 stop:2117 length:1086 start_codon:yes stop_codon:yes gene_type:complete
MQKERNFLGVWLPKAIYLNKQLSWSEKILLVEIESLDNVDGCFASNDYFADFLDVTKTTISVSISKLKKLGFIEQVSFDGRKRVLKVINAEFKKTERQSVEKPKCSIQENLQHNNTDINTDNNSFKNNKKINTKKVLLNDLKKINDIESGTVCIDVDELKNQTTWLEHTSRHLKVAPYHIDMLLKEFISEMKLKSDDFKSLKETKTHFLNWSKIQIKKNRQFGNDSWGRQEPQNSPQTKRVQVNKKPEITDAEKRKLHLNYLIENLVQPFNEFKKDGNYKKLNNFGSLISNELKKHNLLFSDENEINKIKSLYSKKQKIKNNNSLSKIIGDKSKTQIDNHILKLSFENMKKQNIELENFIR